MKVAISIAYQVLHNAVSDRITVGDGAYAKIAESCEMWCQVLGYHLNADAVLNEPQAYQLASAIVSRFDKAMRDEAQMFSDIEIIQIATFINTCNLSHA